MTAGSVSALNGLHIGGPILQYLAQFCLEFVDG